MIVHTPLIRRQQILAVQRSDLENIRNFGGTGSKFSTAGMFFLNGGLWLGVDKITSWFEGPSPAIIWICGFSVLLGIVLCGVVAIFSRNKSDFITQIFS